MKKYVWVSPDLISRWIVIIFVFFIAVSIKNINFILELSGSVFANVLIFIVPPMMYMKITLDCSIFTKIFNVIIITMGLALASNAVYKAL